MASEIVQAQYEQLNEISARFVRQADSVQQMRTQLTGKLRDLEAGAWQGRGSQAFFAEMHQLVLPAVTKLQQALTEAGAVTVQIVKIMQEAEKEAASPFRGSQAGSAGAGAAANGAAAGAASGAGAGTAGAPGDAAAGPAGGAAAGAAASGAGGTGSASSSDLLVKDPSQLFSRSNMESLIGSRFQGENTAELNRLTEDLHQLAKEPSTADPANNPEIGRLLDRIADVRGVDRETFHAQYQTYRQLLENAQRTGGVLPNIDLQKHGDFLGTTVSLRYGKVVGDAFGIDPVFGSLLNPTGGLVGPGDTSYQPSANDAIGYHGVVHDAAGYLYNAHGLGPGYDYLGRDILSTSSPLAGQVGGISWWMSHPQLEVDILPNVIPDIPYVPRFVEQGVGEFIEGGAVRVMRVGSALAEGGSSVVDGVRDVFDGEFREGLGDIASGGGTIVKGIGRSFIDLFD